MIPHIRGVALLVVNPAGEILVLQEFFCKPYLGKYAGMWSIPMETCEPGENYPSTLKRLHEEELGGLPSIHMSARYIGAYRVVPHVWAKLYAAMSSTYHLPGISTSEIGNPRWVPVPEALGLCLRQGAREMIRDYAGGVENVIRRHCAEVQSLVRT